MTTKILNFQAALKAKQTQKLVKAVEFIQDDRAQLFYPEMGEHQNPTKLILGEYAYQGYQIRWKEEDDPTVQQMLKRHRICPLEEGIKHVPYLDSKRHWRKPPFGQRGYFEAVISTKAYNKLREIGVVSSSMLLD